MEQERNNGNHHAFDANARFAIGQVIHHRRFGYRGVIVDVDPSFQLTDEWYEEVALSRPPKDKPWYHILVQYEGPVGMSYRLREHRWCAYWERGQP